GLLLYCTRSLKPVERERRLLKCLPIDSGYYTYLPGRVCTRANVHNNNYSSLSSSQFTSGTIRE
ncbi:hypothetical protein J6590_107823, partial [Homalodisca vitripennis]